MAPNRPFADRMLTALCHAHLSAPGHRTLKSAPPPPNTGKLELLASPAGPLTPRAHVPTGAWRGAPATTRATTSDGTAWLHPPGLTPLACKGVNSDRGHKGAQSRSALVPDALKGATSSWQQDVKDWLLACFTQLQEPVLPAPVHYPQAWHCACDCSSECACCLDLYQHRPHL